MPEIHRLEMRREVLLEGVRNGFAVAYDLMVPDPALVRFSSRPTDRPMNRPTKPHHHHHHHHPNDNNTTTTAAATPATPPTPLHHHHPTTTTPPTNTNATKHQTTQRGKGREVARDVFRVAEESPPPALPEGALDDA